MSNYPETIWGSENEYQDDADKKSLWLRLVNGNGEFQQLCQLVMNEVTSYENYGETVDPNARLDLIQRRIGALSVWRNLESVYEAINEPMPEFVHDGTVNEKILAPINRQPAWKELIRVWRQTLSTMKQMLEKSDMTAIQALNYSSQLLGLKATLRAIMEAVERGGKE